MVNWNNGLSLKITLAGKKFAEIMDQLLEFYESITMPDNTVTDDLMSTEDVDSIDADFYMRLIKNLLLLEFSKLVK